MAEGPDTNAVILEWLERNSIEPQKPTPTRGAMRITPGTEDRSWIARRKEYLRAAGKFELLRVEQDRGYYK